MMRDDPSRERDRDPTYRETTFVARPGETVGEVETVRVARTESVVGEDDDDSTVQMQVEIEETRAEMSGTVEAIQSKLSPDTLGEQAKDTAREVTEHAVREAKEHAQEAIQDLTAQAKDAVRELAEVAIREVKEHATEAVRDMTGQAKAAVRGATIGKAEHVISHAGQTANDARSTMFETIKQNPLPAALAGLSLGWLFMNRSSGASGQASYRYSASGGQYAYPGGGSYYPDRDEGTVGRGGSYYPDRDQGTVGEIASKVGETAGQARDAAGEAVSSAGDTARDVGGSLMDTLRQNPLPAALTGVGLAWLMMNRSSGGHQPYGAYSGDHYWQTRASSQPADQGRSGVGEVASQVKGTVGDAASQVKDTVGDAASQVKDTVGGAAGQVKDTAGQVVGQVQDTTGQLAGGAQHQAQRAQGRIQRMARENPLMAGALAATVGVAAGLLLPETPQEDQLLGQTRDQVMHQVRGVAGETMDKVQRVAEQAEGAAKESAKEQQLTT